MCVCVYESEKNSTIGLLSLSKRKTHEISRSDNRNGFKNQEEKTLKLDANISKKQVKFEIKDTIPFTLASKKIKYLGINLTKSI